MDDDNISVTTDGILGGWIVRISWVPHGGGVSSIIFFGFILVGRQNCYFPCLVCVCFYIRFFGVYFIQVFPFSAFLPEDRHIFPTFVGGQ